MTGPDTAELAERLRSFATLTVPELPLPGRGRTEARFAELQRIGRADLSVVRLCEAHADALAILADAGRAPAEGATYGVWAARSRDEVVEASRPDHCWHLTGRKPWCTGATIVSHALVTAEGPDGPLLVELALDAPGVEVASRPWTATAFAATDTATLVFDLDVADDQIVGAAGSYLERPGFWHGASGVAACWAGGLLAVVDHASPWWRSDPHATAHRAACDAQAWAVTELVAAAGRAADAAPDDAADARRTALRLRHLVDVAVADVITRIRRGCGPAPFAYDEGLARTVGELELYVRQCHAERDLEALGRAVEPEPVDPAR